MKHLALVALVGCASAPPPTPPPPAAKPIVAATPAAPAATALAVKIEGDTFAIANHAIVESSRTHLAQHARVPSGAGLALSVDLDRPGYVTVLEFRASGGAELLYPADGDPTGALAHHAIPADKSTVLQLDDVTGPELLYVIVSAAPLATADAELAALVADVTRLPDDQQLPVAYEATDNDPIAIPTAAPPPPPPAKKSAGCPPIMGSKSTLLTAKGRCDAKKPAKLLTAKGVHRAKLTGNALVDARTDDRGLGAFAIAIEHVP